MDESAYDLWKVGFANVICSVERNSSYVACLEESQYVKRMLLIAIIPVRCSQILKCSAFKFSEFKTVCLCCYKNSEAMYFVEVYE